MGRLFSAASGQVCEATAQNTATGEEIKSVALIFLSLLFLYNALAEVLSGPVFFCFNSV